jgi:hypothetical protein
MIIENSKQTILHINGLKLMPGVNSVEKKWWGEASKHPTIKKYLDLDILVVKSEKTDKKDDAKALTDFKQNEAKEIVTKTTDLNLLKKWLKEDKRPQVKGALKKQIEILEAPPEYTDNAKAKGVMSGSVDHVELKVTPKASDD